ncbi:hypothetical protein ACP4OV_022901 [Aristida adscensionis]
MAAGAGWCLLALALAAACISGAVAPAGAGAASSSPEQAGGRQESVSCMPCSRTYIGDNFLNKLTVQLAQHLELTEMSGSDDLCKGLDDDLDVPMLTELHRQLVGEGLVIIEKLPDGVFADPFELQHFVERKVFLDVAVFGDTNLELPSALSNRSAVEIHFDLRSSTETNCNLVINLPLHARYPVIEPFAWDLFDIVMGGLSNTQVPASPAQPKSS